MHIQSQQATYTTGSRTVPMEESGSSGVTQNLGLLSGRPSPALALEDHQDGVTSSESEPDGCPSDDTDISSEEDRPVGQFASRREFLCYGYLFGRARVTLREYDIMREAENSFSPKEKWPSRWRLQQLRKQMLNTAIPLRREVTTRQSPAGKKKALRKLPDVTVSYIPFSVHIKRNFEDPVTAALFHSEGDARAGTVERLTEFFSNSSCEGPGSVQFQERIFPRRIHVRHWVYCLCLYGWQHNAPGPIGNHSDCIRWRRSDLRGVVCSTKRPQSWGLTRAV